MDNDTQEFTLPPAPRGLCFDRNDFVKTTFSVDNFLADHKDVASLETMRDDLGVYLKVLRLAMIELINKDYANFVNLCATLIGFDKAIIKVQVPLSQLNEEVLSVKQCLEDAMKELSLWLNQRHVLLKKKMLLKYYSQTINCLLTLGSILVDMKDKKYHEQIIIADRAAMQYNQLTYSISKCDSLLKPEQKKQYTEVRGKLVQNLNDLLFQFWNDNSEEYLLRTLVTLSTLNRVSETEMLIRKQAVAPLLQDIISEPALQRSKDGLQGVYQRILSLLDTKLKLLLVVTQHSRLTVQARKYRFLVNCFWCEVESRLEVNLASIFAPGNPQLFYRRYSESMCFIRKLEEYCATKETIKLLHETPEYKSFLRRWNLPVYFQIRFQEVAGGFEGSLKSSPVLQCWRALQDCWSDGIYIEALSHKFWKLSLQLISRYTTWITSICTQTSKPKVEPTGLDKTLIEYSISFLIDSERLYQRLPQFLQMVETKMCNQKCKDLLIPSLKPSQNLLLGLKNKIHQCIVNELYEYFNVQLKQVSDIPRLYRKTNRSIPTKPCTYIETIAKSIKGFNEEVSTRLDKEFLVNVYNDLFKTMTDSYYKYVEDVLVSVHKTEESLRRLKQIRDISFQQTQENTGVNDGDKIRLQLNVDVVSYSNLAETLHVNNVHKLSQLTTMVSNTVKNIAIK
ncbi:putative oligomeric Golgi complex subunit 2 [Danaus plexippus plexippus]|uniref:Conserved oligomeric Golgi complex subunit 2 n=1 Tax=Danaus plexippus plexippus TaxID=278856 RepID=A0A212EZQ0_DANPL|nr:putative oligomeric Golgi complex subunit 2 [Danaus plexippus plexippus]